MVLPLRRFFFVCPFFGATARVYRFPLGKRAFREGGNAVLTAEKNSMVEVPL